MSVSSIKPVAKKDDGGLKGLIESPAFAAQLATYAKRITPSIWVKSVLNQLRKVPELANCDRTSIMDALTTCAQLGITPNGREAHLIPYKDRKRDKVVCNLIIDWKGLSMLMYRNGDLLETPSAAVVCKGDTFEFSMDRVIRHHYQLDGDRGLIIGAYAIARFRDGGEHHEILTLGDIERARKASQFGDGGPWANHREEMVKKTALRRLSKHIPIAPDDADALDRVEESEVIDIRPASLSLSEPIETQEQISVVDQPKEEGDLLA